MKSLRDVDPQIDRLGIEWGTLFLISIGFEKEAAYRFSLELAGVGR